jgi:hypothetical protein
VASTERLGGHGSCSVRSADLGKGESEGERLALHERHHFVQAHADTHYLI